MCMFVYGGAGLLVYVTTTLGDGTEAEQDSEPVLWGSSGSSGVYFTSIREWNGMECIVEWKGNFPFLFHGYPHPPRLRWFPRRRDLIKRKKRANLLSTSETIIFL